MNYDFSLTMRGSDTVRDIRKEILKRYGQNEASYLMVHVYHNKFEKMHSCLRLTDDLVGNNGLLLCYEMPPELAKTA